MKNNITKRILVVALTLVTTFTSLPMNVFAEDINSNIETESIEETLEDISEEAVVTSEIAPEEETDALAEEVLEEADNADANNEAAKVDEVKEEIPEAAETLSDVDTKEAPELTPEPIDETPIEVPLKSSKMMLAKSAPYGGGPIYFEGSITYDSEKSTSPYITLPTAGENDIVDPSKLIRNT